MRRHLIHTMNARVEVVYQHPDGVDVAGPCSPVQWGAPLRTETTAQTEAE